MSRNMNWSKYRNHGKQTESIRGTCQYDLRKAYKQWNKSKSKSKTVPAIFKGKP